MGIDMEEIGLEKEIKKLARRVDNIAREFNDLRQEILQTRLQDFGQIIAQKMRQKYGSLLVEKIKTNIETLKDKINCGNKERCLNFLNSCNDELIKTFNEKGIDAALELLKEFEESLKNNKGLCALHASEKDAEGCLLREKVVKDSGEILILAKKFEEVMDQGNQLLQLALVMDDFDIYTMSDLFKTLSDPTRLEIIKHLYKKGKARFSRLENLTNAKAGHLIFHLTELRKSELIRQEGNRGAYTLTERGRQVLEQIKEITTVLKNT